MATSRLHRHARPRDQLQSPLLKLPAEIRTKIYYYALVRDRPIDLWPHRWIEPGKDAKKASTEDAGGDVGGDTNEHSNEHSNEGSNEDGNEGTNGEVNQGANQDGNEDEESESEGYKIRHQEDLQYVRREMSTGLLGTCRQIFSEAAMYFWRDNHFRFSGRSGWQGLLRFFLTIGPAARSRITRVDVHAPIYMRWPEKGGDSRDLNGRSKNRPKMHMAKIPAEGHLDREAIQRVCMILAQDRTMKEINFIIPDDFRNGDEDTYGGYEEDHDDDIDCRLRIMRLQALEWIKMTVIVEKGGYLAVENGPHEIMQKGWDLRCEPGSFIWEKGGGDKGENADYEKHEVTETRFWSAPSRELDYLVGVKEIFQEREDDSEHANAGKHMARAKRKSERNIHGFGGCRFIGDDGMLVQLSEKFY